MHIESSLRICCYPGWSEENPYQRLFYNALDRVVDHLPYKCVVNDRWLKCHATDIDAIHFHWPESLWRTRGNTWAGSLRGVIGLWRYLSVAKRLNIYRIWTMHNIEHHEGASWVDRLGYRVIAGNSDLVICHSQSAATGLIERYGIGAKVVVMPHGNYAGVYPQPVERSRILADFGFANTTLPLFSSVGQIRQYKGFEQIAKVAGEFEGVAQFLVAGGVNGSFDATFLRRASRELTNFNFVEGKLSEQQFSNAISASEAVILPYRKITGSGALLAALTLGRPIIATDLEYFREVLAPEPMAGSLFPVGDTSQLATRLKEYLEGDTIAFQSAASRLGDYYSWQRCVTPVVDALKSWNKRRHSSR